MTHGQFRRNALCIGTAALLAACSGSQLPIAAPGTMPQVTALAARANSAKYKIVYSFTGIPDGRAPMASLIDVDGTFYGTTESGGTHGSSEYDYCGAEGCGTVFSVTPTGKEKVLHAFASTKDDGWNPYASLIDVGGKLYGTTWAGGTTTQCYYYTYYLPCGTVFSITPSGKEKVLHTFGHADGLGPMASLIEVNGMLWGTTSGGGTYNYGGGGSGTVFSVTSNGTHKVLHSFGKGTDGAVPDASLIEVKGKLYGTTAAGGAYRSQGTVFSITLGGKEKVLHSFGYGTDGWDVLAGLIAVKGTLYGTTANGGAYGRGTVFRITTSGEEKVLYSFAGGSDGASPNAQLVDVGGTLFGTTAGGGAYDRRYGGGGTVFSITTSGAEEVLHSFGRGSDGKNPYASLIDVNGTLYGTTASGGGENAACYHGCGTVFALTP